MKNVKNVQVNFVLYLGKMGLMLYWPINGINWNQKIQQHSYDIGHNNFVSCAKSNLFFRFFLIFLVFLRFLVSIFDFLYQGIAIVYRHSTSAALIAHYLLIGTFSDTFTIWDYVVLGLILRARLGRSTRVMTCEF